MTGATPIRVLVVDDEPPARAKLRRLLAEEPDVEVIAEAADGEEAVAALRRHAPDLVFLDVRMPRLDGFGVIEAVGVERMPAVVFVTAFDEHAVRAFEVEALDYLLKPFAPARLRKVLDRVRAVRAREAPDDETLAERLGRVLGALAPAAGGSAEEPGPTLERLLVDAGPEREVLLPADEIDFVRADGNYLVIHARGRTFRRRGPLTELAARLDPERFLRINRSELVRLDAVAELQPWFHGDYCLILRSGDKLTWSRRFRAKDKDRFG